MLHKSFSRSFRFLRPFCSVYEAPVYKKKPWISLEDYEMQYKESIENPDSFWGKNAIRELKWETPFDSVQQGSFLHGDVNWFAGGKLNITENCIDRHAKVDPNRAAILWEGDEPGTTRKITYQELLQNVSRLANVLQAHGVKKGDAVCIYMPMVPEAVFAMLACARIGAVHSVIFAGFSSKSIQDRIVDSKSKVIITSNEGMRGGKIIPLKRTMDQAIECLSEQIQSVLVHTRTENKVPMKSGRDFYLHEEMEKQRSFCPAIPMESEHPLFILYTSGSTGSPKGMVHGSAGYLLYASLTHKYVFDYKPGDRYACLADIGWITGHSYIVYGPLCNGATTVMFESLPVYPDASRYWEMVERLKINMLYTAPTAIRSLMKFDDSFVQKHDLSSLRVLGSVGEPLNPSAWKWYYETVGRKNCSIVDTYWQTETGGILSTPLPGAHSMKPGSTMHPFLGILPVLKDPLQKECQIMDKGLKEGVLCISKPWPGMAQTILGDHQRFLNTYFLPYPNHFFTGDGCILDEDNHIWITGRVDDVINKAGHRLGTSEIESALVANVHCTEAAVVGVPDDIKGEIIVAFCTIHQDEQVTSDVIKNELRMQVRKDIGPIATPDMIYIVPSLPKTRSGKIMRRMLRKIAVGESDIGDTSTLADSKVPIALFAAVKASKSEK